MNNFIHLYWKDIFLIILFFVVALFIVKLLLNRASIKKITFGKWSAEFGKGEAELKYKLQLLKLKENFTILKGTFLDLFTWEKESNDAKDLFFEAVLRIVLHDALKQDRLVKKVIDENIQVKFLLKYVALIKGEYRNLTHINMTKEEEAKLVEFLQEFLVNFTK